jgi:hypothetical protein
MADFAKPLIFNSLTPRKPIQAETLDGIPDGICDGHSSGFEKDRQAEPGT